MKNREKNEVSIIDVIDLTIELMQTVENFKNLKGKEKCDVIIEALLQVDAFPDDVKKFIRDDLPFLIDILISVDKRDIIIKVKKLSKCCKNCNIM